LKQFSTKQIERGDVNEVVQLHQHCFSDYFLTHLGTQFLRRYYTEFCQHEFDYGVVARCNETGKVVGLVVGTADAQQHFRQFYRSNALVLVPLLMTRFVVDPLIRKTVWQRMAHIKAAVRSLIPGLKRPASQTLSDKGPKEQCPLRLLSIAVATEYRGSGVAGLMTAHFEDVLRQAGHKRVGLSVLADNARAIAFYKKAGWETTYSSEAGWWFEKDL
jgi:ribosomal protein S18 acetylase RimI-like enzyme